MNRAEESEKLDRAPGMQLGYRARPLARPHGSASRLGLTAAARPQHGSMAAGGRGRAYVSGRAGAGLGRLATARYDWVQGAARRADRAGS